jgi:hypothetical protein
MELKIALKCEIQLLFKNLEIAIESLPPSNYLANASQEKIFSRGLVNIL